MQCLNEFTTTETTQCHATTVIFFNFTPARWQAYYSPIASTNVTAKIKLIESERQDSELHVVVKYERKTCACRPPFRFAAHVLQVILFPKLNNIFFWDAFFQHILFLTIKMKKNRGDLTETKSLQRICQHSSCEY